MAHGASPTLFGSSRHQSKPCTLTIRKADIDPDLRATFEQYGVAVMQQILSVGSNFRYKGKAEWVEAHRDALLKWLTEQSDRQEAKEDATFAMELAIMLLVASSYSSRS